MLGDNLLPVHSEPCTARICQISHTVLAEGQQPVLTETKENTKDVVTIAEGSANILQYLNQLNKTARDQRSSANEAVVTVTAPFAALMGEFGDGVEGMSSTTGMTVMDTPGKLSQQSMSGDAGKYGLASMVWPGKQEQSKHTLCS